jgi:PhnB protein
MQLYPHLTFDGRCEAAFQFYEKCTGGKTVFLMTWGEMPPDMQAPEEWRTRVAHATFDLAGSKLSGSDPLPGEYQPLQGVTLQLNLSDPAEATRIFNALSENGTVQMPLAETFWALLCGVLVDPFGVSWMINCEKPA